MALVIVDMQPSFPPACWQPTIDAVRREILRSRCNLEPIIFLEHHRGYMPTHKCLTDLLRAPHGYEHFEVPPPKKRWSGADVVVDVCRRRNWPMAKFRLCGVETFQCVAQTAEELTELAPRSEIEVIGDACNDKVHGWLMFPQHPNIRIIEKP
ncbi:MAG: hypothetical protein K2X97_06775 [Mycobacteriaceae bacterium]|nr:hypothetical protein [Mycobacteriaceae bacterium]